MSDFWEALFLNSFRISFSIFSLFTSWKENFTFFYFSFIAIILGWFLYFKIAQKIGPLIFPVFELRFWYSVIFKFFTIFEKNLFNTTDVSDSLFIGSPFSLRWILSFFYYFVTFYWLIRKINFTFPKFCVIYCNSYSVP